MNVLIAEDDYRVAMIHSAYVDACSGCNQVGHVLNGHDLFKRLAESPDVDLLLLDLYFPDIERLDLLRNVRTKYPALDIIIVSASDDVAILQHAKRFGVFAFLQKPVDESLFKQTLEDYAKEQTFFKQSNATFSKMDAERVLGGKPKTTSRPPSANVLPTGIDAITLERVYKSLKEAQEGLTIEGTCEEIGISRTTARRYLEHLVREAHIYTQLSYGEIGRPERRYRLK
ncbi:response regulator [Bacillus sp. JCM 19041]|uniref:response regulator n=1 Tax=Bacillus sp. JCM 19041 TaxID=1460637 RepID=UPI0006D0A85E